uniref:Uncharacterized protein n=1 Tax=Anguilla anguilla TaxID=7936 RepID=A0A0E9WY51_ANGAN
MVWSRIKSLRPHAPSIHPLVLGPHSVLCSSHMMFHYYFFSTFLHIGIIVYWTFLILSQNQHSSICLCIYTYIFTIFVVHFVIQYIVVFSIVKTFLCRVRDDLL